MSKHSRLLTITVPWRKFCAALPALALLGGGLAISAPESIKGVAVSSDSPAIVVPDEALALPAPEELSAEDLPMAEPEVAASGPSAGAALAGSSPVAQGSTGIPGRALEGYQRAASLISSADPACHIDWPLLAAIGRVESNHGRFGGNRLDPAGVAQPGIIGIPLDGSNGTARITDTDGGLLDRDSVFDRAVGPMQFIPGTWAIVGVDADGDGAKNPQDMVDAASSAAVYLCSGPGDLNRPGDLSSAIMRYNASDSYVRMVTALAATYRLGVSALPDSDQAPTPAPAPSFPGVPIAPTPAPAPSFPGVPIAAIPAPAPSIPGMPIAAIPAAAPSIPGMPITTPPATTPPATIPPVISTPSPAPSPDPIPTPTPTPTPAASTPNPTPTPDPTPAPTASTPTPTVGTAAPTPDPTPTGA